MTNREAYLDDLDELLKEIDLDQLSAQLQEELQNASRQKDYIHLSDL